MDRQILQRDMKAFCDGASFITCIQFARYMGISKSTAQRKLRGIERVDDKYYFIPEVAKALLNESRY